MPNAIRANSSGRLLRVLLIINGILLLLPALVFFDMFGMVNAFIAPFTIQNGSSQPIRVTPLGSLNRMGDPYYLPLFERRLPAIRSSRRAGFELAPGEQQTFLYDTDDISLTDILIESGGRMLQLSVPVASKGPPPSGRRIIVPDLDRLPPARPEVAALADDSGMSDRTLNRLLLLPALTFGLLLVLRWRTRGDVSSRPVSESVPT